LAHHAKPFLKAESYCNVSAAVSQGPIIFKFRILKKQRKIPKIFKFLKNLANLVFKNKKFSEKAEKIKIKNITKPKANHQKLIRR